MPRNGGVSFVRKVNMTISLAFLAPDLVKAAIDGRLPPWPASAISRPNGLASARCEETLKTHSKIVNYARGAVSVASQSKAPPEGGRRGLKLAWQVSTGGTCSYQVMPSTGQRGHWFRAASSY